MSDEQTDEELLAAAGWEYITAVRMWRRAADGEWAHKHQAMRAILAMQARAAYERGLRRGLAIASEHMSEYEYQVFTIDYDAATEQMEREIEEAKR